MARSAHARRTGRGAQLGRRAFGNTLYQDFTPVGVLDWEMATVGPREVDLAWMLFLHKFFDDMAERFGMPANEGLPAA